MTPKEGQNLLWVYVREWVLLRNLKCVDITIEFIDKDDSACDAIGTALEVYDNVLFCNGGDRGSVNTPWIWEI